MKPWFLAQVPLRVVYQDLDLLILNSLHSCLKNFHSLPDIRGRSVTPAPDRIFFYFFLKIEAEFEHFEEKNVDERKYRILFKFNFEI